MLQGLLPLIHNDPFYQELIARLRGERSDFPHTLQILSAARPALIASLRADWAGPVVLLAGSPEEARDLGEQVDVWSRDQGRTYYYHAPDAIFYDRVPWDRDTVNARIAALSALSELRAAGVEAGRGLLISCSVWSLMTKSISPLAFRRAIRELHVGQELGLFELLEHCARTGYEGVVVAEEPGTFSHRGSIIDVFPPNSPWPVRIDFFGDEIDSMRLFDPATQRSIEQVTTISLAPASEALPEWGRSAAGALAALDLGDCNTATRQALEEQREALAAGHYFPGIEYFLPYLYPRSGTLLDFVPSNALVLVDDVTKLRSAAQRLENQALNLRAEMAMEGNLPGGFATPYHDWGTLENSIWARGAVDLGHGDTEVDSILSQAAFLAPPLYGGHLQDALEDASRAKEDGQRVVLVTRQAERLSDLARDYGIYATPTETMDAPPEPASVLILDGIIAQGWQLPSAGLQVLSDAELFGWVRPRKRRPMRKRSVSPEFFFGDLNQGDYVVHVDYGIGRYHGMVQKTINGLTRDYFEIEYGASDRVFIPVHQADRLSRYVGADAHTPRIHRLGGNEWKAVREKAQKTIRDIAVELLELYAAREIAVGHAFAADSAWQHELEASFPYEETDDQLSALFDVKADMERPKPMDRLICGDVGYGKTEVALRAAFKAVMDGKQVAVLVPTTVLAQQHFHTFRRRLRAFPISVEMLSRFRTPEEQEDVLQGLITGRVDLVIGTHRLLSNDVAFKDLGMLIIDEEQRFGVGHKEKLKQIRREVDVLTLTATPIPRTLYMALSGARDMSVIETPPENRQPVRTLVSEWDDSLVRKAILREIDRGGQVYFVHNRVQDIDEFAERVRRIVPEASVVIGHGQMPEDQLAQVMLGFAQGEHDVLLCTTIIESGLDIPSVNTIIIDRAGMFGLAQLYQLRGRVGRGLDRAYAYLFYKPPLSEIAQRRLLTIQEATELGSGFRVAMQDMEIRGAGEILGSEQHGQIAAVGFDLYCRLLQRAVEELHADTQDPLKAMKRVQHQVAGTAVSMGFAPNIDLPISAYLPESFMPDEPLRLRFYRRLARIDHLDQVDQIEKEMQDRFGLLPEQVTNLLYVLRIRSLAAEAAVQSIGIDDQRLVVALPVVAPPQMAHRLRRLDSHIEVRGNRVWLPVNGSWQGGLKNLLEALANAPTEELVSA